MKIEVLDSTFTISGSRKASEMFIKAFIGAYDESSFEYTFRSTSQVNVVVHYDVAKFDEIDNSERALVHKSPTMEHWNFYANTARLDNGTIVSEWIGKNTMISFCSKKLYAEIFFLAGTAPVFAGEMIFHFCRNIALYIRKEQSGFLYHSSAIKINNKAVLFCGDELAGKTTLFTEAILKHQEIDPIANDRSLIIEAEDQQLNIVSWPGYISYCDGTILNYPELKKGAIDFEQDDSINYKTHSWGLDIKNIFVKQKGAKRMYPMKWLSDIVGKKYTYSAPLGAIVFTKLDVNNDSHTINEIKDIRQQRTVIEKLLYDEKEPAFLNWHCLNLSSEKSKVSCLIDNIKSSNIPVFEMNLSPFNLAPFHSFLDQIGLEI